MITVLIADDSNIMRKIVKTNLQKAEIKNIMEAKDGKEALKILKANDDIDLIFLDINMPEMNGVEVLRELNLSGRLQKISILVISSEIENNREFFDKYGIKDFIPKPFNLTSFEKVAIPLIEKLKTELPSKSSKQLLEKQKVVELFANKCRDAFLEDDKIVITFENASLKIELNKILDFAELKNSQN